MNTDNKSLRDEFAGQALCGILAGSSTTNMPEGTSRLDVIKAVATSAYEFADAMLAARTQHENPQTAH